MKVGRWVSTAAIIGAAWAAGCAPPEGPRVVKGTPQPECTKDRSGAGTGVPGAFSRSDCLEVLSCVSVTSCGAGGPAGEGHVRITFAPDGTVARAVVDQGPYAGTEPGHCVERAYAAMRIPAFAGSEVTVGKSFHLE